MLGKDIGKVLLLCFCLFFFKLIVTTNKANLLSVHSMSMVNTNKWFYLVNYWL